MFTMLFMYSSQEENLLTSVISVHHFRLSLWDATNNSLVNSLIMLNNHIFDSQIMLIYHNQLKNAS